MIRKKPTTGLIKQQPRKMLKLDLIHQKQYNEFEGNSQMEDESNKHPSQATYHEDSDSKINKVKQQKQMNINRQILENQKIFKLISQENLKFRKVDDITEKIKSQKSNQSTSKHQKIIKKQKSQILKVKFQEGSELPALKSSEQKFSNKNNNKKTTQKHKFVAQPSSNWKKFLQNSKPSNFFIDQSKNTDLINGRKDTKINVRESSKFVAMDCEFVKCGQNDQLARISIVSEFGQTLYDSYIKPEFKVTDFLTEITGITYSHIKQAPKWSDQIGKVKKILMGKIVIGHTLDKDLEVTKLNDWKGISQKINIADFSEYKDKGGSKTLSLKRMALSFLNRNIQSGWHSSVQDSVATMDLFKLNKKKILKEFKLI